MYKELPQVVVRPRTDDLTVPNRQKVDAAHQNFFANWKPIEVPTGFSIQQVAHCPMSLAVETHTNCHFYVETALNWKSEVRSELLSLASSVKQGTIADVVMLSARLTALVASSTKYCPARSLWGDKRTVYFGRMNAAIFRKELESKQTTGIVYFAKADVFDLALETEALAKLELSSMTELIQQLLDPKFSAVNLPDAYFAARSNVLRRAKIDWKHAHLIAGKKSENRIQLEDFQLKSLVEIPRIGSDG